ncbi:MAG TPA: hypothetical protein VJL33_06355 [Candidatus Bathyarchaeia archaeon]|nr:hypothetical protein [Candidatus Bathyarchaeia archaeon]
MDRHREKACTIRINNPVKGSLARIVKAPAKTVAMINALPKNRRLRLQHQRPNHTKPI